MNPYRLRAYIYLFLASIIWAIAGPVIKFTLGRISSLPFLTYRFGISSVIALISVFFLKEHFPKNKKTILLLVVYSLLTSTISLGLLFFGLEKTTVLDMSLITIVAPLLIAIAGVVFFKEHITNREKVGMAIALLGTCYIIFEPLFFKSAGLLKLSGNIFIGLYLLTNTCSVVIAKKLLRDGLSPVLLTNSSFLVGFLSLLPVAFLKAGASGFINNIINLPISYHAGVFYIAIFSGTIAYTLSNKAQKTIEISEAGLFSYLYPILSAPLAVLWLGEKITTPFIVGSLIIALGVIFAEYKKPRLIEPPKPSEG